MQGWVKLHRSLADNELWFAEPFTYGQAWVDILIHANHKPRTIFIRNIEVDLSRGDLGWSEVTMSKRWKWSRGKVRRYLAMLEKRGMIVQQKTQVTTVLSVCNYSEYQGYEQQGEQPTEQQGEQQTDSTLTPDGTQRKNGKNEENGKDIPVNEIVDLYNRTFPEMPQVKSLTSARRQSVKARWVEHKTMQSVDRWGAYFDYIRRIDFLMGRTGAWKGITFDWIVKQSNMLKIIEGNYEDANNAH